jgi:hypothetical protein
MTSTTPNVAINFLERYLPVLADQFKTINATTAQNELYGAVDLSYVSWLERSWASYYIWMGNPVLATGIMSFLIHEVRRVRSLRDMPVLTRGPDCVFWPGVPVDDCRQGSLSAAVQAPTRASETP